MREVCSRLHNLQLTLFLSHVDLGKYWLKFQECCLLHNSTSKRHYTKENVTDKYQSPFLNKGCTLLLLVVLTHMCVVLVVSYCSSVLELFVWRLGGMKLHLALKRRRLISHPRLCVAKRRQQQWPISKYFDVVQKLVKGVVRLSLRTKK